MCSWLLNIFGLSIAFLGAVFLIRFGVSFHGDAAGVSTGKDWTTLWLTMECGQRVAFIMLSVGFVLQLIAQFL
jgi:hypothetical protein